MKDNDKWPFYNYFRSEYTKFWQDWQSWRYWCLTECWRCYWRKCPEMLLPGCGGQACGVVVGSDPIMHMVASNFLETQYAHENTNTERPKLFCRIFVLIKMQENFLSERFWYSAWCIYYSKGSGTLGWSTSFILMPSPISMLRYITLFCVSSMATKPLFKISWLELLFKAIASGLTSLLSALH